MATVILSSGAVIRRVAGLARLRASLAGATSTNQHPVQTRNLARALGSAPGGAGGMMDAGNQPAGGSGEDARNHRSKVAVAAALLGSLGVALSMKRHETECRDQPEAVMGGSSLQPETSILTPDQFKQPPPDDADPLMKYGRHRAELPTYRRAQIESHSSPETGIWVTYKHGVYDITEFVKQHPGGRKLLLAAGKQLEPFFQLYAFHRSEMVMEIMESFRIGNLHPKDAEDAAAVVSSKDGDPFRHDPKRHPILQINSNRPFNAEPPLELLAQDYLTPNDIFFTRNHLPVPHIDVKNFDLEVKGDGIRRPLTLSLSELRKWFPTHAVIATVQCAGNRRKGMSKAKTVKGLTWGAGAISTAEWRGVKLTDVLAACGAREQDVEHVIFQGQDTDGEGMPYEASIPAATAFNPRHDVLLAFQMNGADLPLDHGYPLRVIVPGVSGARQVKWLRKIILSKRESEGHFQKNDYRSFNPSVDWSNADFSKVEAIQEAPVQAAICYPEDGAVIDDDVITIRGYAWSGGGRGIIRVDVSFDGGKTWMDAELHRTQQKLHQQWAWTMFEATFEVPETHEGPVEIVCKAVDSSHNTQPEKPEGIWNIRGLLNNSWHRITVNVER